VPVSNDTGLFHLIYEIKAEEQAAVEAAVLIADSPKQEEFLEENIEEYLAFLENDYPENGNTKMDLHGPDITGKKTSAGKEGDAISTQRIYKCVSTFCTTFLLVVEIDKDNVLLAQ
jgi:hypothetical protein